MDQGAVVVILLHDQVGDVQGVYPGGHLLIVLALAGDGVHQHGPLDVRAAEQADGLDHPGGDPPGVAALVDLELRGGEHHGGVVEAQVAVNIPVQGLGEGVFHPLAQADHRGLLGDHVHHHIGGQAAAPVGQPLEQVGVADGGHPDGTALVVDLGGVVGVFKLADHVAEGAHLPVAQILGGGAVQSGDLAEGDLGHIVGEVAVFHGEQIPVGRGPEDGQGDHIAHCRHGEYGDQRDHHGQAAALHKGEPGLDLLLGGGHHVAVQPAGQQEHAQGVHDAQQDQKAVKLAVVQVQGGQRDIEVYQPHRGGDEQAEQGAAQPAGGQAELFRGVCHEKTSFPVLAARRGGLHTLL